MGENEQKGVSSSVSPVPCCGDIHLPSAIYCSLAGSTDRLRESLAIGFGLASRTITSTASYNSPEIYVYASR